MPVDYSKKLDALRELYDRVQQKEADIPESAYAAAGLKNKARLKDIEKEISTTKKKVSHEVKKVTNDDIEKEYEALAQEHNMTIEEFKKSVVGKERQAALDGDFFNRHAARQKERAEQRELKEMRRQVDRGDFDMAVDYV